MARTTKTQDHTAPTSIEEQQAATPAPEAAPRAPRPGSKLAKLIDLLESEGGVTIAELMSATGWQQHTVRGALAGSITKKAGRSVSSEKVEGRGRVYRIGRSGT